jgi:hypothetical protein
MSDKEPTDVEIRVTTGGTITPLRFTWHETWHTVAQIGRTWADEGGEHWLVMAAHPNLLVELVHTRDNAWFALQKAARPPMV